MCENIPRAERDGEPRRSREDPDGTLKGVLPHNAF
jgi:hypothetical protein